MLLVFHPDPPGSLLPCLCLPSQFQWTFACKQPALASVLWQLVLCCGSCFAHMCRVHCACERRFPLYPPWRLLAGDRWMQGYESPALLPPVGTTSDVAHPPELPCGVRLRPPSTGPPWDGVLTRHPPLPCWSPRGHFLNKSLVQES